MSQQATRQETIRGDIPLDLREAAACFELTERELRRWVNLERIPCERAVRNGRVEVVVRPTDVERFLAEHAQEAAATSRTADPRPEPEPPAASEPASATASAPSPPPAPQAQPRPEAGLPAQRLEDLLAERDRRQRTEVHLARSEARCEALERHLDDLRVELKATRGEKLALLSRTERLLELPAADAPRRTGNPWILAAGGVVLLGLGTALALALVEGARSELRAGRFEREANEAAGRALDLEVRADGLSASMATLRGDLQSAESASLGVRRELVSAEGRIELERRWRESATAERERALVELAAVRDANANLLGAQAAALAERATLATERDAIRIENTGLLRERDVTASERDSARRDLGTARLLMSDARRIQELVASERDTALDELRTARGRIESLTLKGEVFAAERDRLAAALLELQVALAREQRAREHGAQPEDAPDGREADAPNDGQADEPGAPPAEAGNPTASEAPANPALDVLHAAWARLAPRLLHAARLLGR
ncbi:MAG: hypothetical protein CMJ84_16660 [Planctomycetes bacterium]|nr:hypothetical protein [Planctomycetota bacterium]MDP6410810.1 hypothetical protein [Planctomycetota bacterium]